MNGEFVIRDNITYYQENIALFIVVDNLEEVVNEFYSRLDKLDQSGLKLALHLLNIRLNSPNVNKTVIQSIIDEFNFELTNRYR